MFTGAFFTLFGLAVLGWCLSEIRIRRVLLRGGARATARVLPGRALPTAASATASAAPGASGAEAAFVDHADTSPVLGFQTEGGGVEVVVRPRGWTSIRRTPALPLDALVPVSYDPARPQRVVVHGVSQAFSDVFWLLLGLAFAAAGVVLLLHTL